MNSRYEIVSRIDVGRTEWDAFVDASDEAWLWHRFDFQDVLKTWPGSVDRCFALRDKANQDEIVALIPLRQVNRSVFRLATLYVLESFGGPACANAISPKFKRELLTLIRLHVVAMAQIGRCLEIRIMSSPMAPAFRGELCPRVNPFLEMGCDNTLTQTWVVDLRSGREAVWKRMAGRARTAVRKAEKAGVTVREACQDDLHVYYRLHQETYHRTGVPPHTKDYFRNIWDSFFTKGFAHVWIAELDGEPVAAENFGIYKRAAIYWTGAASAKGLDVEANSLLQWTAMQWMLSNDLQWYETGETFPQYSAGKHKGLSDFKKSFGGSLYPYYKGQLRSGSFFEKLYQIKKAI